MKGEEIINVNTSMDKTLQAEVKSKRSKAQAHVWKELSYRLKQGFQVGDSGWLYLARVQSGLSKKFSHLWRGVFRILDVWDDFRCKLKIEGTAFKVHVSRLKPRALFPDRPTKEVEFSENVEFDAALLPEDVSEPDEDFNVYEVEAIQDVQWVKRTRTFWRV
ncbi:hypothetical protein PHMEG_00033777 [Phytophthora megakarya]|uniref:Uncharacterized protein n=1 Tax=Phytophthora megakarya TaxID=4795 RepID=A0A225UU39_9STRA|nr:hypothetical protein PHMEG_00033777 [Phytophthora megakarya]